MNHTALGRDPLVSARWMVVVVWKTVCVTALAVTFAMLILQVLSRYVFNLPILWTNEIAQMAFVWMVFVGGIGAVATDRLVRMDVVSSAFGARIKAAFEIAFHAIFLSIAIILVPAAYRLVASSGRIKLSNVPVPWSAVFAATLVFFVTVVPIVVFLMVRTWRTSGR